MYIGKVLLTNTWAKLEDLIKAQVSGQSSFAFDADKTYQLQGEGVEAVRLCDFSTTPAATNDGFEIAGTQVADYKPSTGYLYVRADLTQKTGNTNFSKVFVKVNEMEA